MTAEQRYWRAVRSARLIAEINLTKFLSGDLDVLPCSGDIERRLIIAEIEKALSEPST